MPFCVRMNFVFLLWPSYSALIVYSIEALIVYSIDTFKLAIVFSSYLHLFVTKTTIERWIERYMHALTPSIWVFLHFLFCFLVAYNWKKVLFSNREASPHWCTMTKSTGIFVFVSMPTKCLCKVLTKVCSKYRSSTCLLCMILILLSKCHQTH